mgnify:CR=1 FL=1
MHFLNKNVSSLSRYLSQRLYLALIIIALAWGGVSIVSYHFALDDTSEFYLIEDAENALFLIEQGLGHDLLNTEFRQIFLSVNDLPADIKEAINTNIMDVNRTIFIATQFQDIYVLPYSPTNEKAELYVVHSFEKDESINIASYYLITGLMAFFMLAIVIKLLINRIDQQTQLMAMKIGHLTTPFDEQVNQLIFSDYQHTFDVIKQHYSAEKKSIYREKEFASFLSHELRQPLSRMSNSLSLIDQIDNLPFRSLAVIDDIKSTNKQLSQLTNIILQLWQDSANEKTEIDLVPLLEESFKMFASSSVSLNTQIQDRHVKIFANVELVNLMLKQLLQNSMQYADTKVLIKLTDEQLHISNDVRSSCASLLNERVKTHGYGIGLVMVNKVCRLLGWRWDSHYDSDLFTVSVNIK